MLKKTKQLLLLCLITITPFVFAGGMPKAIVKVENAVNIEIAPYIWVSGTVIGRFDSKIAAEVTGVLENILDVGDQLEKNEVIAEIDGLKYQLALNEISAEVKPIETMVEFFRKEAERLEKLAKQQLPDLSLRELREEFKQPDPETGKRNFDELAYSAELRKRLEAVQPVDSDSLQVLARQRRDMMLAYLNSLGTLDETRVAAGELLEAETGERGWIRVPLVVQVAE